MRRKKFSVHPEYRKKIRNILIFLVLSLVAHLIFLSLFFNFGFQQRALALVHAITQTLSPEQQQALPPEQKAAAQENAKQAATKQAVLEAHNKTQAQLRAGKSNFGWVMFDDPPTSKDAEWGSPHAGKKPKQEKTKSPEPVQTIQKKAASPAPKKALSPEKKIEKAQEKLELLKPVVIGKIPDIDNKISSKTEAPVQKLDDQNRAKFEPESPEEIKSNIGQEKIQNVTQELEFSSNQAGKSSDQEGLRGTGGKPKKNIIALTKGFIDTLHGSDDGQDPFNRDGDPNIRPDFEDLKYISYDSKIIWHLQASWKEHFMRRLSPNMAGKKFIIDITIDEQGRLVAQELLESTGMQELDDMVMKNTQRAAPFPPLPKHFETTRYRKSLNIMIVSEYLGG